MSTIKKISGKLSLILFVIAIGVALRLEVETAELMPTAAIALGCAICGFFCREVSQ